MSSTSLRLRNPFTRNLGNGILETAHAQTTHPYRRLYSLDGAWRHAAVAHHRCDRLHTDSHTTAQSPRYRGCSRRHLRDISLTGASPRWRHRRSYYSPPNRTQKIISTHPSLPSTTAK